MELPAISVNGDTLILTGGDAGISFGFTRSPEGVFRYTDANGQLISFTDMTVLTVDATASASGIGSDWHGEAGYAFFGSERGDVATINFNDSRDDGGALAASVLEGRGGNDALVGSGGDDTLRGGNGDDRLAGSDGDDRLGGGAGADALFGGIGDDRMWGDAGNDSLYGYDGVDRLIGGKGDDFIFGGSGRDRVDGGAGDDVAAYDMNEADYSVVRTSATTLTVRDIATGEIDTVTSVEHLQFADRTVDATTYVAGMA